MSLAKRIYRMLLRLYPARFREEYSSAMERQFADESRDLSTSSERVRFWMRTAVDLAASIPQQAAREVRQDLRYAGRIYRRRPLVSALAFLALALGIGATTGVFSVLNALLLRGLPFADPEQLVEIQSPPVNPFQGRAQFQQWRSESPFAQDIAAYSAGEMNLGAGDAAARVTVAEVSASFFHVLGSTPQFGRGFLLDEDVPGREGVAVIGHGFWQSFFGGDPRALGRTIEVNGTPLKIIGVARPGFEYPGKTAVWVPMAFDLPRIAKSGVVLYRQIARLKPGLTLRQASQVFTADIAHRNPGLLKPESSGGFSRPLPKLIPLREQLAGPVGQASLVLMGVVLFVLLVGCANVAHLLLTRVVERSGELALRTALGASRARLVQQLITESVLLTVAATAAGLLIARWAAGLATTVQPAPLAAQTYTILDWRVLGFAAAVAVLTGILFGVIPTWMMGREQSTADALRTASGRASNLRRARTALVTAQVALTVTLTGGSFLMSSAFLRLLGSDLGFRTDHIVTLNVSLAGTGYKDSPARLRYFNEAIDRLRQLPGVESAAAAPYLPLMQNMYMASRFKSSPAGTAITALTISATPDYFRTLRATVIEGREFTSADGASSAPVVIINEEFARALGVAPHAAGKSIFDWKGERQYTVAGVVRTLQVFGPGADPGPQVYFPFSQTTPLFATFVVRVNGVAEQYLPLCRDVVRRMDPRIPVYDAKTLAQRLDDHLARPRFYTVAITALAGFALLLALIGIYGASTYAISQRTKEIGIRVAIGANLTEVRMMLLRQGMWPILAGISIGLAATLSLGRFIRHVIVSAPDPGLWTCAPPASALMVAGAVAVWVATRRLLAMDAMAALRSD